MSDITESFKCTLIMSKQLDLLYKLHGFDSKSEYLRHLITSDLGEQQKKAALYKTLLDLSHSKTTGDTVIHGLQELKDD